MPLSSAGSLRTVAEPSSKATTRQRLRDLEQAVVAARTEATAAQQLLVHTLCEADYGLLLVGDNRRVRLINEAMLALLALKQPPTHWVGQPAALLEAHLRARLPEPAALDRLLAEPAVGCVALSLPGAHGQAVELQVRPLPAAAGGGYLVRSRDAAPQPAFSGPLQALASSPLASFASVPEQHPPAQQALTDALLEAMPALVVVRDAQGTVLFQNSAARTLQHQAQGPQAGLAAPAHPLLAHLAADGWRTGKGLPEETCLTLDSGEVRWFQIVQCPLPSANGAPLVLVLGTDLTGLKRTQQTLERAKEAAEDTARAKEAFLANMSHEIRTPLNGVLGMAAQLAKTPLDSQQQHLLNIVRTSGHFLLSILNNVLDISRITSGKLELEQAPFEFCQVASEALASLAWQAREKGLEFSFTPLGQPAPYPWVLGDSHRLSQILVNLVGNALKFTTQGYVHVHSHVLAHTDATLTLQVEVADSGIGIAPDKQALIFELFAQENAETQRQYGGTGLGLSICRALAQHMGGTLRVASQPGAGSTFTLELTLPRAVPTLRAPLPPAASPAGSLVGLRVLLVDDNEINRGVARYLLEGWGTVLHEAHTGPEALALLAAQPFDVVLLDIQLPGLSGVEVLQQLRQHPDPQRASTPAIAFTANALHADAERYLAAGFTAYLAKPFAEADLYRQLEACRASAAPEASFDFTYLHAQAQGSQVLVSKIIRAFLRSTPPLLRSLRAAAAAGHWAEVTQLVHQVRSNVQVLGLRHAEGYLAALQAPPPAGPGPAATAFAQAAHRLADLLEAALHVLPRHLP